MYVLYLEHSGTKGMTWGRRLYQYKDGSLTPLGKLRYGKKKSSTASSVPTKTNSNRSAALEKARKAKAEKKQFEEARQKALKTGTATEVLKYKDFSTRAELEEARLRINTEQQLMTLSDSEKARQKSLVDKVLDEADKWRNRTDKAVNAWNTIVKIHNSLVSEDDAWQKLGDGAKSVRVEKAERAKAKAEKEQAAANDAIAKEKTKFLANAVAYDRNGDLNYDNLNKLSPNMTLKEFKEAVSDIQKSKEEQRKKAAQEKAAAEKKVAQEKARAEQKAAAEKKAAEQKKKETEQRNAKLREYYMDNGTVDQIIANKDLFSPAQFGLALTKAAERKEKKK